MRRSLPLADWPAVDRQFWARLEQHDADLLSEAGAALHLRTATLANYRHAYGALLAFLRASGDLLSDEDPASRVTRPRVQAWRRHAQARGLAPTSRRALLRSLQAGMRLLAPGGEWGWITRPGGVPLRRAIPGPPKAPAIRDPAALLRSAGCLGEAALALPDGSERRRRLRDAALVAILAEAAPRVRSLACMGMATHLKARPDGTLQLRFPAEHMKSGVAHALVLGRQASALLRAYLDHARDGFPGAAGTDALWLGMKGPMTTEGIGRCFEEHTQALLGTRHGPHAARHWLSHAARHAGPQHAREAANLLGHSEDTAAKHYAQAAAAHATRRLAERVTALGRDDDGARKRRRPAAQAVRSRSRSTPA